jgi:hypothetical protein
LPRFKTTRDGIAEKRKGDGADLEALGLGNGKINSCNQDILTIVGLHRGGSCPLSTANGSTGVTVKFVSL